MRSILSNMFPTYDKFVFHYTKLFNSQVFTNDCGLRSFKFRGVEMLKKDIYRFSSKGLN